MALSQMSFDDYESLNVSATASKGTLGSISAKRCGRIVIVYVSVIPENGVSATNECATLSVTGLPARPQSINAFGSYSTTIFKAILASGTNTINFFSINAASSSSHTYSTQFIYNI